LAESVALAHRGRDRDALARSMIGLARALGRAAKDRDEAVRLLAGADAIAEALSWAPARRLGLREAQFEVAFWAQRDDDVDTLGAALLADPSVPDPTRIRVQSLMAVSLDRRGRFAEAIAGHAAALALAERVRGPEHPQVAMVLANGVRERTVDAPDERNVEALRRALRIREAAFGPDAPSVGELHRQLGDALFSRRRHDEAVAAYERAVSIARAANDDGGLFFALANFSRVLGDDREHGREAQMLDEAASLAERHFGADSIQLAQILVNRGISRFAAEEFAEGTAEHERALAILGAQLPAGDPALVTARMGLARFLARAGRGPEALALYDAGARSLEGLAPEDHARVVALALNRAMLLDSAGMTADALAQWRETAALAEHRLPDDHPLRAEVLLDVGRRLNDAGEGDEAAPVLRRAAESNARADADATRAEAIAAELRRAR
jgi:tetratricopeptide (TPR) repeat protein